jgi:hypothetical protein
MPDMHADQVTPQNPPAAFPLDPHPLMRLIVETLSDMKVEEDYELRKLRNSPAAPSIKSEIARRIREHGRQRQAPYRAALASLEERVALCPGSDADRQVAA